MQETAVTGVDSHRRRLSHSFRQGPEVGHRTQCSNDGNERQSRTFYKTSSFHGADTVRVLDDVRAHVWESYIASTAAGRWVNCPAVVARTA